VITTAEVAVVMKAMRTFLVHAETRIIQRFTAKTDTIRYHTRTEHTGGGTNSSRFNRKFFPNPEWQTHQLPPIGSGHTKLYQQHRVVPEYPHQIVGNAD